MSRDRAIELGFSPGGGVDRRGTRWEEDEDEVLRAGMAAGETSAKIAERLPDRTPGPFSNGGSG
jgi:hypothetical protein